MQNKNKIESRAGLLWGKDIWVKVSKNKKRMPSHSYQLKDILKKNGQML